MAATAAAAPSDAEPLLAAGDPHVVLNKAGVIVRAGVSKSSALVGEVGLDGMVAVDAYAKDERGTVRLRLASPRGWVSAKLLRPLSVVEAVGRSGASLVVVYAVNAKVGAKWYYGWLRDVLLADVDAVFVPVGDDFFGEAGRRRAAWLPANGDDKVAARARLLAGAARCLVVWNDFEHDRSVVERFVDAAPCPLALFHVGDERTSDALAAWEPSWPGQEKSDSKFASTGVFRARAFRKSIHASRALREMIARPKISRTSGKRPREEPPKLGISHSFPAQVAAGPAAGDHRPQAQDARDDDRGLRRQGLRAGAERRGRGGRAARRDRRVLALRVHGRAAAPRAGKG